LQGELIEWLRTLPRPVGIMAANDSRGREVLEACRACELRVPSDVAVIGVGNDDLLCQLSRPALSSVDQGATKLGYAAASMLDRLMEGERPERLRLAIEPAGVIQRMSTEALAITDPDVAKAMVFIRSNSSAAISVRDVVRATAVSRSTLEGRFRPVLRCTIREAVRRAHLERARHLITDTSLPLKQIAAQSGFKTVQHMTTCFVKAFGETPGRYRRSHS
jgi:LacI family transcriptional regulator